MQFHFPFPILVFEFEVPARIRSGNPEGSISSTIKKIGFRLSRVLLLVQHFSHNLLTQEDIQINSKLICRKKAYLQRTRNIFRQNRLGIDKEG